MWYGKRCSRWLTRRIPNYASLRCLQDGLWSVSTNSASKRREFRVQKHATFKSSQQTPCSRSTTTSTRVCQVPGNGSTLRRHHYRKSGTIHRISLFRKMRIVGGWRCTVVCAQCEIIVELEESDLSPGGPVPPANAWGRRLPRTDFSGRVRDARGNTFSIRPWARRITTRNPRNGCVASVPLPRGVTSRRGKCDAL